MAKRDKEGDGAQAPARRTESRHPARAAEQERLPARRSDYPLGWLRDEIEAMFGRWPAPREQGWAAGRFWNVDVEDTDKEVVVHAEAPGFEAKDFDIHVSGNMLTIQAEHKHEEEKQEKGYHYAERRYGRFQRTIPLPSEVDAGKAEAHYRNGVLELHLPRTEEAQRQRIEVKT